MEILLCNSDWQTLRKVLRCERAYGRDLRRIKTRKTKGGAFLTELVKAGLLATVPDGDSEPSIASEPEPLRKLYVLTTAGHVAAEYGMYEGEFSDELQICVANPSWKGPE